MTMQLQPFDSPAAWHTDNMKHRERWTFTLSDAEARQLARLASAGLLALDNARVARQQTQLSQRESAVRIERAGLLTRELYQRGKGPLAIKQSSS